MNAADVIRPSKQSVEGPRLLPCDRNLAALVAGQVSQLGWATTNLGAYQEDVLLCRAGAVLEKLAKWLFAHARGDQAAVAGTWTNSHCQVDGLAAMGLASEELFQEFGRNRDETSFAGVTSNKGANCGSR